MGNKLNVLQIIGDVRPHLRPVFITWAHKPPKRVFSLYCDYAKAHFDRSLLVIVDDIAPNIVEHREWEYTARIASAHRAFFEGAGADVMMLSDLWDPHEFARLSSAITLRRIMHYLPSNNKDSVGLGDVLHFLSNIYAYFIGSKYADVFLIGANVVGRFFAAKEVIRKVSGKDISAIVFSFINAVPVEYAYEPSTSVGKIHTQELHRYGGFPMP